MMEMEFVFLFKAYRGLPPPRKPAEEKRVLFKEGLVYMKQEESKERTMRAKFTGLVSLVLVVLLSSIAGGCGGSTSTEKSPLEFMFGIMGIMEAKAPPVPQDDFKVIGAAFPRTGTASLKIALSMLGYKPYHMDEFMSNPEHHALMIDAYKGNGSAFQELALKDGYNATLDLPTCFIWEQALKRSPSAKVILTVRDPAQWAQSYQVLLRAFAPILGRPFKWFVPFQHLHENGWADPGNHLGFGKCNKHHRVEDFPHVAPVWAPWVNYPDNNELNIPVCIEIYKEYMKKVRTKVPKEQLLEYSAGQGWEPLTQFLGTRTPDVPYPYVNKGSQMYTIRTALVFVAWTWPFLPFLPILIVLALKNWCCGHGSRSTTTHKQKTS